jgi:hypothetical protein
MTWRDSMDRKTREALAAIMDKMPEEFLLCRREGHDYIPLAAKRRGSFIDCKERCSRGCGVTRSFTLNQHGEYAEPPARSDENSGYRVKGHGHEGTFIIRSTLRGSKWGAVADGKRNQGRL